MDPSQIDPTLLMSILMGQGQDPNSGMGGLGPPGAPMGMTPGIAGGPSLGALLQGYGGGGGPPGTAPSTSSAPSPTGDQPVPWAPGAGPGNMGINPVPGITVAGGPGNPFTGTMTNVPGTTIGSVPPGFDTSTQSPGTTTQGGGVPSTQGQAGGAPMNPLGGLAGAKFPGPPQPIMPAAAHAVPGTHPTQVNMPQQLAALLSALIGARTSQPAPYGVGPRFGNA